MHRSKWQSPSGIWEKSNSERRGKREERREKRDGSVPEGRDGGEKGRALGETREERKEKREERDNHNQDERAEEGNSSVPEWCRKGSRLLGAESKRLNNEQLHCNCTATGFVGGSNRCILRVDRDCVARIHRAYAVAMALPSPRPQAGRKKAERREKRANGRQLDSLHFYRAPWPPRKSFENQSGPPKWPPARIPAFLRCPVTTSMRTQKTSTSVRGSFSQKC